VSAFNSDVDVTVGVAFGDDVYETVPTWVDITADVREFSTRRGRSHILDQMQAGEALLTVDNSSGNYNPENTVGTHYPNVSVFNPIRIQAVYNTVTYDLFRGFAEAWTPQAQAGGKDPTVQVKCVDAFRLFAMFEADLTESSEFTGTRIGNLLDTAGWPAGWRDLDTGNHMVQALTAEFDSVLGQIHRSVLVEQGLFWIAGDGDATFRDGNTLIQDKTSVAATFSDDGNDLRYVDLELSYDDGQLWNKASVTRVDGEVQSNTLTASKTAFGQRDLHLAETLHVADGEALALSQWLTSLHGTVRVRSPELVVKPEDDPTNLWPDALGLEFLDRVNIERALTGDDFDKDCHVEGITHDVRMVGGRSWTTSFQLSPVLPFDDFWILGTSELGVSTRLGY
jgi:hypothetical protein